MNILIQVADHSDRFGYSDGVTVTSVANDPREAIAAAQSNVESLLKLAVELIIDFDPAKTDLKILRGGPKKKIDLTSL
ncbi:BgtA-20791 [Blumeria graminis f. sp. tritici]|uniref:BgtA-20791 n=2 Tax=Blumeria graminis f. sp. tritici TaxID=62690 RepID=A0A9X9MJP4_BLUGR|nr:hypothetical protein BGT96224_A20791 [Blumeria graminis f. sp. tritici 96224]VDB90398.1 BgtA-20791 [Blumeria graminis f. sp. tritici]